MRRGFWVVAAAGVAALVTAGAPPAAQAAPGGFNDTQVVPTTFNAPTAVKVLPGGRLLVLEKGGALEVVHTDGSIVPAGQFSVCTTNERGLLSAALDPGFATNGVLYLYMTRDPGGGCRNTLVKVTMRGDTIDAASEQVLVDNIVWTAATHNGGTVEVGRDGYLYLSVGEGSDPSRSQDMSSLGGKVLRLTTSGDPAPGNPFLATAGHGRCARIGQSAAVCEEIYALGLRNPFRMAFDPNSATTRFRINDVGQTTWEEVDEGAPGANYGWPTREGPCPFGLRLPCAPDPAFIEPVTSYEDTVGTYIVGGAFIPNGWWGATYDGGYLFADGGSDEMWLLPAVGSVTYGAPFTTGMSTPTDLSFGVRNGERALFYVNHGNGELRKIVGPNAATTAADGPAYLGGLGAPEPPQPPAITPTPGAHVFTAYPTAARVFDSRNGIGGPVGKVTGGQTRTVPLGVPAGATAALVNITLDNATPNPEEQCAAPSYLVAWKPGTPMPATSNGNVGSCDVAANIGVLAVDAAGATDIQVYADTHVILDVLGYYTEAPLPVPAGRFIGVTPTRLLDTRNDASAGNPYTRTNNGNESIVRFPVAGRGGVPAGATTVSLTVTAIGPGSDASGYVTAYAGGTAQPPTSTVNHTGSGDTRANLALVPLGADGSIELYLYQVADVVLDVGGWVTSAADPASTVGRLRLTTPARIADSRNGLGLSPLTPGGQVVLEPAGVPAGSSAIVQNVTMVSHAPGWICATPNPWSGGDVSIQNARTAGQDRPAMTLTTLGTTVGQPRLRYCSQEHADVIVDVFGWFE
jgi:glucose/arabinose dehydrogenase